MIPLDVIYHLNYRAIILGEVVKHQRMRFLDNREPLPVGVHLRREFLEYRMFRIRQNAQGSWRNLLFVVLADGLEHAIVPVIGLEESANSIRQTIRHPKHLSALFQDFHYFLVQISGNNDALLFQRLLRINPKFVGVSCLRSFDVQRNIQFGWFICRYFLIQDAYIYQSLIISKDIHHTFSIAYLPHQFLAVKRSAAIIGYLYLSLNLLAILEAELLHFQQRNHRRAPLAPFLGRSDSLALHKRIEDAYESTSLTGIILNIEQLKARHIPGSQIHLYIGFIEFHAP